MSARILYLDCETSPVVVHAWGLRDLSVGLNQIVSDPEMIGFGYKQGNQRTRYASTWDEGGRKAMLTKVYELLDWCDVAVHYNGNSFDIPWIMGELARDGFTPPSPFKNIDLYRVSRRFRFPSHKLQYVSTALGLNPKLETGGHGLWMACLNGDEKARRRMARYCINDVDLLPPLLEKMRPWLPASVNMALLHGVEGLACQKCGGTNLKSRGVAYTASFAFPQFRCEDCGGWTRDRRSVGSTRGAGL
jgi:hypothetical protein